MLNVIPILMSLALLGSQAAESDPRLAPVTGKVEQLAWMSGSWSGNALGGFSEEHWTEPRGGSLAGMFRLVNAKGATTVYELLLIEQKDEQIVMSFRHFGPGHKPWEPNDKPLTFHAVKLSENEVVFENQQDQASPRRMTYRRAESTLTVHVQGEKDGRLEQGFHVRLERSRLPS